MNNLKVIEKNGQLLVDSRDVAEMTGKHHKNLLRDIDGYVEILLGSKMSSADFFIESFYKDSTGRTLKCYLLTKKGCDMTANKMTGEKGVLFTATYVTKFEEMEQHLKQKPLSQLEILQGTINQLVAQEKRMNDLEVRLIETEKKQDDINEIISLNPTEWRRKVNTIINKMANKFGGYQAYQDIRNQSYKFLEERAHCNLSTRLTNKKRKMALEGVLKTRIDKTNNLDVIAEDSKLTEIYLAIIKEMAIKHGINYKQLEVVS
jgi:Rha family phage regulatory protein